MLVANKKSSKTKGNANEKQITIQLAEAWVGLHLELDAVVVEEQV